MKWLRTRVRGGATFALLAMALQIFCTFGHVHLSNSPVVKSVAAAKGSTAQASLIFEHATTVSETGAPTPGTDGDALCPLCLIGNLVAAADVASAPLLALPVAYARFDPPPYGGGHSRIDAQTPFWSRGPPTS